jgi:pimeloyl-ACP methyl ester carboxylesterase
VARAAGLVALGRAARRSSRSWCWDRVVGPLRDAGHRVEAVDLPGRDGTLPDGYDEYVDVVAAAVDRATAPVVLVGHSFGAIAVSQFAERSPPYRDRPSSSPPASTACSCGPE